jgi:glutamate/tyrosine decarboxylase-like PLP-dependent enzyme
MSSEEMSRINATEPCEPALDRAAPAFGPEAAARWVWSAEEIRRVGRSVVDLIAAHLTDLPDRPVFRPVPGDLASAFLQTPVPEAGQEPDRILKDFAAMVERYPFGNGHPRFFGWVNSPPAVMGIFAEALAAMMNPSVAGGNHAAVYVEHQVIGWCKQLLGFPADAGGLLVSGGSMGTLTGLAVARHVKAGAPVRTTGMQGVGQRLMVYASQEAHGCIQKAVELLGLGSENLRRMPTDERRRMHVAALEAAIRRDLEAGHRPMAVVASAGTTNSGAIDPLDEIVEVCRRYDLWLHVDGAYGAPAILTRRYRAALAPLALADSVALDPHKWLYVPVDAGLALVRDAQAMRDTFSLVPPYLRTDGDPSGVGGLPWLSEFGFEQTRAFRALKVWMTLKHHGVAGYAEAVERDCALADYLAKQVSAARDLELIATGLSVVCFRYVPAGLAGQTTALNALNERIVREIQLGGAAFLTSTTLDGRFVLRACIINPRTRQEDVEALVAIVRSTGARMAGREA